MRRAMLFNVRHHLLLERQIFKYGFNHQLAVRKTAVVRRAGDHRQGFITLACLDMAALDLLIKVLPAVLQRVVDSLRVNVFDAYRQFPFTCGNERNAAAHQPTPEHANCTQRSRLSLAARIFFHLCAGEEDAAQRP